jgi:hypothetical protein
MEEEGRSWEKAAEVGRRGAWKEKGVPSNSHARDEACFVAGDGVSSVSEVHADLVGPACFWFSFDQSERTPADRKRAENTKGR